MSTQHKMSTGLLGVTRGVESNCHLPHNVDCLKEPGCELMFSLLGNWRGDGVLYLTFLLSCAEMFLHQKF